MTTLRTAAQQALEAWDSGAGPLREAEVFEALRAALAEPVQEQAEQALLAAFIGGIRALRDEAAKSYEESTSRGYKLHDLYRIKLDRLLAAVTSRVALAPPKAEPVQEPVANDDEVICPACCHQFRAIPPNVQQLMLNAGFKPPFTAPPQRKPLSEEEIDSIWDSEKAFADIYAITRAIERAHGIT